VYDSSPFVVSSCRTPKTANLASALNNTNTIPFRIIMTVMRERNIMAEKQDIEWDRLSDLVGGGLDDEMDDDDFDGMSSFSIDLMDIEEHDKLMAVEKLDTILHRLSEFMLKKFPLVSNMSEFQSSVDEFLKDKEHTSLAALAEESSSLLGEMATTSDARYDRFERLAKLALQTAQEICLANDLVLGQEIEINGPNDVSGLYLRIGGSGAEKFFSDLRSDMGWAPVELKIWREYMDRPLLVKVPNPREITLGSLGCANGPVPTMDVLKLHEASRPSQTFMGLFGNASGQVVYAYPHNRGICKVLYVSAVLRYTFLWILCAEGIESHVIVQTRVGGVTSDWATVTNAKGIMKRIE